MKRFMTNHCLASAPLLLLGPVRCKSSLFYSISWSEAAGMQCCVGMSGTENHYCSVGYTTFYAVVLRDGLTACEVKSFEHTLIQCVTTLTNTACGEMGCPLELWAESSSNRVVNYCCFIIEIQYMLCILMCYFASIWTFWIERRSILGKHF